MDIRFATDDEQKEWDKLILSNPDSGNIFQSLEFAEQKKLTGWTPRFVLAGKIVLTVLEKKVPTLGKLWYVPKGPGVGTVVQLGDMLPDLQRFAAKHGVFAVKVEPELLKSDDALAAFRELGLVSVPPIQPNFSTVLIDLSPDLDDILAGLNQKGRHAIRRAERDGVTVKRVESDEKNCRVFYDLLADTAKAQGFSVRSFDYQLKFWRRFSDDGMGQLFFAYVDGKVVAGAYAMVFGHKSTYKDGASVRERTAYGASHLLQWEVITWAKEQGSKVHDLCGAPPSESINDETHPHYGIGRFKTSFNKHVTDYVGAYDLVVRPAPYKLWIKLGQRAVRKLWRRKHHEDWY